MNINQMKYVLAVARSSSIRDAAGKLFLSQPALSASIKELENELGIVLFERTNRGVVVTEAGKEFLTYAQKAVSQFDIVEEHFSLKNKDRRRFSVSTQHYNFAIRSFAEMLRQFEPEQYLFSIHETKTNEVLLHVRDFVSEVGIVSYSSSNEALMKKILKDYQLEFVPLMRRETYAYVWKDHSLAEREMISIEELKEYPCVSFDQSNEGNFYLTEEALADYDFKKLIKTDDRATSMELIAALGGFSVGSGMLSGEDQVLHGMVSIKLKEDDPLTIGYIRRRGYKLSGYGTAYISELMKYKEV